ncbi:MAG: flavin reductase family protein [Phycisphaerae bacterium]|nr:flavin reductase family protein [Phycisphaerae bacterium]NUQ47723.1 flavin reductase family protein [Phycisphaerae bacterium]
MSEYSAEQVGRALARIPSGCAILTARHEGRRSGMLASWIQQAGFDPPAVSVAVKKGRPIEELMDAAGSFALNLIGDDPAPMFRHFGRGYGLDDDAFERLNVTDCDGGVALVDAMAILNCRVAGKYDAGDHWIYVGHVTDAKARDEGRPYVHLRKNGMNY